MILAVDTGGTKTLIAEFSRDKKLQKNHRFETPKNPDEYLKTLSHIITTNYSLKNISALSIAIPGSLSGDTITLCPNLGWRNVPLPTKLRKIINYSGPIFLENDANLAGLAETHALAKLPKTSLYITISTGIGTGFTTNGVIDPNFRTSEGGHMILEYDGLLQIWEHFASGKAIYETYGKYAHDINDQQTWEAIADKIARGLYALIPMLQPDIIIIGGSIGTYFSKYQHILKKIVAENISDFVLHPQIASAKHPEEAVLYGCNLYAQQQLT